MWESLEAPWQACLEEAWTAYQAGSAPIGAVVLDKDGRVISRGRSTEKESMAQGDALTGTPLSHAETNALINLPYDDFPDLRDLAACHIYTTTEPCPLCLGAFYMSGVRTIHFAARDPYAGSVDLLGATPYMSHKPVTVERPSRPELETMIAAWYIESVLPSEPRRAEALASTWATMLPEGAALGRSLYASGDLRRMADQKMPVASVIDALAAQVRNLHT